MLKVAERVDQLRVSLHWGQRSWDVKATFAEPTLSCATKTIPSAQPDFKTLRQKWPIYERLTYQ